MRNLNLNDFKWQYAVLSELTFNLGAGTAALMVTDTFLEESPDLLHDARFSFDGIVYFRGLRDHSINPDPRVGVLEETDGVDSSDLEVINDGSLTMHLTWGRAGFRIDDSSMARLRTYRLSAGPLTCEWIASGHVIQLLESRPLRAD